MPYPIAEAVVARKRTLCATLSIGNNQNFKVAASFDYKGRLCLHPSREQVASVLLMLKK